MHGAVADGCKDLAKGMAEERSRSTGKPVAEDNSEAMMALAEASTSTKSLLTQTGERETCGKDTEMNLQSFQTILV